MATQDLFNIGIPDMLGATADATSTLRGSANLLMWIIIISIFLIWLTRMMTHRYHVRLFECVEGGYVIRYGRYHICYDRESNLEYLRPMFGSRRLPNFPSKYWQKVNGIPFLGIRRSISIIQQNPNSYKVLSPPGMLGAETTMSWVYFEQLRQFNAKQKKQRLLEFLQYAAPLAVIVACIGFLIYSIFYLASVKTTAANAIIEITNKGIELMGK